MLPVLLSNEHMAFPVDYSCQKRPGPELCSLPKSTKCAWSINVTTMRKVHFAFGLSVLLTITAAYLLGLFTARANPSLALYFEVAEPVWPRPLSDLRRALYLKMGASPEHKLMQFGGETAFDVAVTSRDQRVIAQLSASLSGKYRREKVEIACRASDIEVVRALLQQGPEFDMITACSQVIRDP